MVGAMETLLKVAYGAVEDTVPGSDLSDTFFAPREPQYANIPLDFDEIIGKSMAMREIFEQISIAATTSANIIIYGESGTGLHECRTRVAHLS